MTFILGDSFTPTIDITHARISHSEGWRSGATITTTGAASGHPVANIDNTLTYETWTGSDADEIITWDFGSATYAASIGIAAHDLGSLGHDLRVQYSDDDVTYTTLVSATTITDDSPILCQWESQQHRYWRIRINGGSGAPSIGVAKLGGLTTMRRPIYAGNVIPSLSRNTVMRTNYSETGEVLGRAVQRTYLTAAHEWRHLDESWIRSDWLSVQKGIESEPFWIAWRPDNGDCVFAQASKVPVPQLMGIRDLMSVSLEYRALSYE